MYAGRMRTRTFFTALFCAGLIIPACGDDTSTSVGSTAVSSASTTASTGGAGGRASASGGQGGQGGTSMGNLDGPCEAQTVATPIDVKAGKTNDGSGFIYADVANAKGLALFFHGGGGGKGTTCENASSPS